MDKAREALEQHYSFLLPRYEFSSYVLPMHMLDVAKRAKSSAIGLDGWTHQELASLPMDAWFWFLIVCSIAPLSVLSSVSAVFRRIPISKTSSSVCAPNEIRPIDLFSVLLRLHATATTRQLIPWTRQVLHPGQLASTGGVLVAVSRIAWYSELSLVGIADLYGVAVDFEKNVQHALWARCGRCGGLQGFGFP